MRMAAPANASPQVPNSLERCEPLLDGLLGLACLTSRFHSRGTTEIRKTHEPDESHHSDDAAQDQRDDVENETKLHQRLRIALHAEMLVLGVRESAAILRTGLKNHIHSPRLRLASTRARWRTMLYRIQRREVDDGWC